jgi:hypothetical protein
MARTHLGAGHDVVVPQFLGRSDFIERLETLAADVGARFVEIALIVDRAAAITAFEERRGAPENQGHLDAASLVERSDSPDPIGEMHDRYVQLLDLRPSAHRIPVVRGEIDDAVQQVARALEM